MDLEKLYLGCRIVYTGLIQQSASGIMYYSELKSTLAAPPKIWNLALKKCEIAPPNLPATIVAPPILFS